jgi:hypothetical protein
MGRRRKKSILDAFGALLIVCVKLMVLILKACAWLLFILVPGFIYLLWSMWGYSKSEYKNLTHNSLFTTYLDKGKRGEYLLYRHLKRKNDQAKWLFNLYIPRNDGRTTEIDALMIHPSGIYVFESKNYAGWIFGNASRKEWTQCIKPKENAKTQKYRFLNPLLQNNIHVKYLKPLLSEEVNNFIYPVVVFGNRCKLKHISLDNSTQKVTVLINVRKDIAYQLSHNVLNEATINKIYMDLLQYTQVDDAIKEKHIRDIHDMLDGKSLDSSSFS